MKARFLVGGGGGWVKTKMISSIPIPLVAKRSFLGKFATYPGGGFVVDLPIHHNESLALIQNLKVGMDCTMRMP